MPSQSHGSKRLYYSQVDLDSEYAITRSQPSCRRPASKRQSTLSFSQPQPTTRPLTSPEVSLEPPIALSDSASRAPSENYKIAASKRAYFEIDLTWLGTGEYRLKPRTVRGFGNSKVSWT